MNKINKKLQKEAITNFRIYGDFINAFPYGTGHINSTYKALFSQAGRDVHYLIQRINEKVFKDPVLLMKNVSGICSHLKKRAEEENIEDASRKVLTLIPSKNGDSFVRDSTGGIWRCYLFIENAAGYDVVENEQQAEEAAKSFGEYLMLLDDYRGERLNETIPDFHNTPKRYTDFISIVESDPYNLVKTAQNEISFFMERKEEASLLINHFKEGRIPERITHNDTKLNNVLIDSKTNKGLCVIDLDTSMPGLSLYDFGDLVRSSTSPVSEDHKNPADVYMNFNMFTALVNGFLKPGKLFLNEYEIKLLPEGGRLMTLEVGLRFLTDYLNGSTYFKTAYPEHNLVRSRTQIELVKSIEKQKEKMNKYIESVM